MNSARHIVTLALATGIFAYAGSSQADVTVTTQPQPPPPQATVVQTAPQPPPPQVVTVPPPPPASTTTTTAAPYAPPGNDQYAESSVEHRPNKTMLKTGLGIFVVSYAASGIAGLASSHDSDGYLLVPLVGPWLDLGNRGCANGGCGDHDTAAKAAIVTSGIFQTVGALLTVGSFIVPEGTTTTHESHTAALKPEVHVTPVSYGDGAGIGAVGRF
jgi:hypothetical protein